jgi:hypothetical protein
MKQMSPEAWVGATVKVAIEWSIYRAGSTSHTTQKLTRGCAGLGNGSELLLGFPILLGFGKTYWIPTARDKERDRQLGRVQK